MTVLQKLQQLDEFNKVRVDIESHYQVSWN